MAVTLKDVAALAGVSVKTISNVVNGHAFVKPGNRRRVEEALSATGYRPNLGARNLRRGPHRSPRAHGPRAEDPLLRRARRARDHRRAGPGLERADRADPRRARARTRDAGLAR